MIRQLTNEDWEFLVNQVGLGKLQEVIPLNHDDCTEPLNPSEEFSDAQTMVKVSLTNHETNDTIDVFFIFSSYGLENLIWDNKIAQEKSNDINLYYLFPEAREINASFYGLMDAHFGVEFTNPMMSEIGRRLETANLVKHKILTKIQEYELMKNGIDENEQKQTPFKLGSIADLIQETMDDSQRELMEELNHIETYMELQRTFNDILMEAYIENTFKEEAEREARRAEIRSKLTIISNDPPEYKS